MAKHIGCAWVMASGAQCKVTTTRHWQKVEDGTKRLIHDTFCSRHKALAKQQQDDEEIEQALEPRRPIVDAARLGTALANGTDWKPAHVQAVLDSYFEYRLQDMWLKEFHLGDGKCAVCNPDGGSTGRIPHDGRPCVCPAGRANKALIAKGVIKS